MKLIRINTETGMFIEDVIVSTFPQITAEDEEGNLTQVNDPQYVSTPCEGGFYHPKWNGESWEEGLTPEEIQIIIDSQPIQELTPDERIAQLEAIIDAMLNGGV